MRIKRQIIACMVAAGMVVTSTQEYAPLTNIFAAETSDETTLEDVKVGTVLTLESGAKSSDKVEWAYGTEGGDDYVDSQWCEFADTDENAATRKLKITAVKEYIPFAGSGYIKITASVGGSVIHTWYISTVASGEVTAIDITQGGNVVTGEEYTVVEGKELRFSCKVEPEGCKIIWSSDNERVASVKNGTVTGLSEGKAVITAKGENGVKAEITVQVAAEKKSGDYTYVIYGDGTTGIVKYNGSEKDVTVPDKINNYKVTAIEEQAFASNDNIETVVIPEGVVSIGQYAFAGAPQLLSVSIPESVTSIGSGIFIHGSTNATILCVKGSYAETYAKENIISYIAGDSGNVKLPVISKETAELEVGKTMELTVENAEKVDWTWLGTGDRDKVNGAVGLSSVLKNKITVTGEEAGTVTLTANVNGYRQVCTIKVKNPSGKETGKIVEIDPTSSNFYLEPCSPLRLEVGDVSLIGVKLTGEEEIANGKEFTWSSSDDSVATVSGEGTVSAKGDGECVIKAVLSNGMTASCNVVVGKQQEEPTNTSDPDDKADATKAPDKTKTPKTTEPVKSSQPDSTASATTEPNKTKAPATTEAEKTETPGPTDSPSATVSATQLPATTIPATQNPKPTPIVTETPGASTPEPAVQVKKAAITKVKRLSKNKIRVSIKKRETVNGYQILVATDKKFKKNLKKVSTTSQTVILKNLKKGKTYYIKVRAYKLNGKKKIYGKYSIIKKVK